MWYNIFFLFGLAILTFGGLWITYLRWGITAVFTFTIGGAIGANLFNVQSYGFEIFGLTFGIDSILYSLFTFGIILIYLDYNKKEAMSVTYTTIASFFFSAIVQFVASCASHGWSLLYLQQFGGFLASMIATYVAITAMLFVVRKLRNSGTSVYFDVMIGILLASIINSIIYFGLSSIIYQTTFGISFLNELLGSYIGKGIAIIFAMLTYYLIHKNIALPPKTNKKASKKMLETSTKDQNLT